MVVFLTIERRGRREIEQPKVGPKGELSGSERVIIEIPQRGGIRCTNVAIKKQTSTSQLASVSFFDRQSRQAVICLPRWRAPIFTPEFPKADPYHFLEIVAPRPLSL